MRKFLPFTFLALGLGGVAAFAATLAADPAIRRPFVREFPDL